MKKKKANQAKINCPYCGSPALLRPASYVHGKNTLDPKSHLYVCSRWPACDSYVSAHKKSRLPMGTLANSHLRHKRILAHRALTQLQKARHMDTWATYLWLQAALGLDKTQAHIGMFSEPVSYTHLTLPTTPYV